MREALLAELGSLVMEMQRQGRQEPALVERKAREAMLLDAEARTLQFALESGATIGEVVAAGIAGACPACGTLVATDDRFCPRCGTRVAARRSWRFRRSDVAGHQAEREPEPRPEPVG